MGRIRLLYFLWAQPQLQEQPAQLPEQLLPLGQPMHLTPFFFARWT